MSAIHMIIHQVDSILIQIVLALSRFLSDIKASETSLIFQSSSVTSKESNENEILSSNINKRPHLDENTESIYTSELDEQLSPSKRARRSISSQESFETFRYIFLP